MAYSISLFVHSYLRWLVLIVGVIVLARGVGGWRTARPWTAADNWASILFVSLLDLQLLVGLLLYVWLSPATAAFFANAKAGMKEHALRFFGVEHLALMLIAIALVHVGRAVGKRKQDPRARHKLSAVTTLIWFVLVLAATPWPGLSYGRVLLRGF